MLTHEENKNLSILAWFRKIITRLQTYLQSLYTIHLIQTNIAKSSQCLTKAQEQKGNTMKHKKENKELMKSIKDAHKSEAKKHESRESKLHEKKEHKAKKGPKKVEKVMKEFKEGKLHSGSKKGPEVSNKKQAIAIALSEAKKSGEKVKPKKKK